MNQNFTLPTSHSTVQSLNEKNYKPKLLARERKKGSRITP
jgi:hypothetical protein